MGGTILIIFKGDPSLNGKIDFADLGIAVSAALKNTSGNYVYTPTGAAKEALALAVNTGANSFYNVAKITWYLAGWERDGVGTLEDYNTGMGG